MFELGAACVGDRENITFDGIHAESSWQLLVVPGRQSGFFQLFPTSRHHPALGERDIGAIVFELNREVIGLLDKLPMANQIRSVVAGPPW